MRHHIQHHLRYPFQFGVMMRVRRLTSMIDRSGSIDHGADFLWIQSGRAPPQVAQGRGCSASAFLLGHSGRLGGEAVFLEDGRVLQAEICRAAVPAGV